MFGLFRGIIEAITHDPEEEVLTVHDAENKSLEDRELESELGESLREKGYTKRAGYWEKDV